MSLVQNWGLSRVSACTPGKTLTSLQFLGTMFPGRCIKWVHSLPHKHPRSCITSLGSFVNLLDNQPPPVYHPRHGSRGFEKSLEEQDSDHQMIDRILPMSDDAVQQASLLSTISEMFSNLTCFNGLAETVQQGAGTEQSHHPYPSCPP